MEIHQLLYRLHVTDTAMTQLFEQKLGISLTRYQLLRFLVDHAPCSQMAVQEDLRLDPAALSRHFKILEEKGYIHRMRNPNNQREMLLSLTDFAKEQLLYNPPSHHLDVQKQMETILSQEEQQTLYHLMDKLLFGLEKVTI